MWLVLIHILFAIYYLFLYHAENHILVYDFSTVITLVEYKYLHFNTEIYLFAFLLKI